VEQKNWAVVRTVVGYHRYDTEAELLLLNRIWTLQSMMTNYFLPQQKLISKVRDGAKVTKKYDKPKTRTSAPRRVRRSARKTRQSSTTSSSTSTRPRSKGRSRPSPASS
jgi:hypothetical protein